MGSELLLAVTDDERYLYDDIDKMVFTYGEWVIKGGEWADRHQVEYEVLPAKWNKSVDIEEVHNYVEKMAVNLSSNLAKDLNKIHKVNFTNRTWEKGLYMWLIVYISSFYDKYCDLLQVKKKGDFCMVCEKDICIQNNLYALKLAMNDICYNIQQYTCLMNYLGFSMIDKDGNCIEKINYIQKELTPENILANRKLCEKLKNMSPNVRLVVNNAVYGKYCNSVGKITCGLTENIDSTLQFYCKSGIDLKLRKKLNKKIKTQDRFEQFIYENVGYFIPIVFLEGFHEIWLYVNIMNQLRAVVSHCLFEENDIIRMFAIKAKENGGMVYQVQHGGKGIEKYIGTSCIKYADVFYSWGWSEDTNINKFKKMPSIKISQEKYLKKVQNADKILFVENLSKYRIFRFNDYYDSNKWESAQEEDRFIKTLNRRMFSKLVVRPYLGCEKERTRYLCKVHPGIKVSKPGVSYCEAIAKARMVVNPCLVTTWLEVLAADIPVIIIRDTKHIFYASKRARRDIQLMKKVGILQETPIAAADFINKNYDDIDKWWKSDATKKVVKRLKREYAYSSVFYRFRWKLEILKIFIQTYK